MKSGQKSSRVHIISTSGRLWRGTYLKSPHSGGNHRRTRKSRPASPAGDYKPSLEEQLKFLPRARTIPPEFTLGNPAGELPSRTQRSGSRGHRRSPSGKQHRPLPSRGEDFLPRGRKMDPQLPRPPHLTGSSPAPPRGHLQFWTERGGTSGKGLATSSPLHGQVIFGKQAQLNAAKWFRRQSCTPPIQALSQTLNDWLHQVTPLLPITPALL